MSDVRAPALKSRADIVYGSRKAYKANLGLSTAFRQWQAPSHCKGVHGYSLEFAATFEADELNEYNWVVDFGALKSFKGWLENAFDHTMLVATDDPELETFRALAQRGALDIREVPATGCEAVARYAFERMERWLAENGYAPRVRCVMMEVSEHDGNSAYVRLRPSVRF